VRGVASDTDGPNSLVSWLSDCYERRMGFRVFAPLLALASTFVLPDLAFAGGYDTPMLYSARHMGMGGTAVAYVDDPSALFHNPAGLSGTDGLTLMGDFSLLIGNIDAAPDEDAGTLTSENTVGPFFLLGASGRITEWLTAGFAVYPVASAGAEFNYMSGARSITDSTRLVFIEMSPGVAFEVPDYNLALGVGYRVTLVTLERSRLEEGSPPEGPSDLDFEASGANFTGFRVGLQWAPLVAGENGSDFGLSVGAHYRHKTRTEIDGADQFALAAADTVSTAFTLPSRMSFGVRADYGPLSAAFDLEYAFNSQNEQEDVVADFGGFEVRVPNVFDWSNAFTTRVGVEYRLLDGMIPLRVGYVWDQKTGSGIYPTAFGTPPAATHVVTVGGGFEMDGLSVNLAFAHRRGGAEFTQEQFDAREDRLGECQFCGYPGDYFIRLNGIYVDVSYEFDFFGGDDEEGGMSEEEEDRLVQETEPEPEPEPIPVAQEPMDTEPVEPREEDPASASPDDEPTPLADPEDPVLEAEPDAEEPLDDGAP